MLQEAPTSETLDLSGLFCPQPILRAKKALAALDAGGVIKLICTDPAAPSDFAHFCKRTGHTLIRHWKDNGKFLFLIQKHSHLSCKL